MATELPSRVDLLIIARAPAQPPGAADGDVWVGIAGVEVVTEVPSRTITGWMARGGPNS